MKTFRYVTTGTQIDFTMPSWLFFFFKRLVKIKTKPNPPGLQGFNYEICIDESGREI